MLNVRLKIFFLIFFLTSGAIETWAQSGERGIRTAKLDSLKLALKTVKHDTAIVKTYLALGELEFAGRPDTAIVLWQKALIISEQNLKTSDPESFIVSRFKKFGGSALSNIGAVYNSKGDIPNALEYFTRSLKLREEAADKKGIAQSLNNLGTIYIGQGNIPKALEYFQRSLLIKEELGDKKGMSKALNNLGGIYLSRGDISKALDNNMQSIKILEELGDKIGLAGVLNNVGRIYHMQGDIEKALECNNRSLKIQEEIDDKQGMVFSLNYVGLIYYKQKNYPRALEYYNKSLSISEKINDPHGTAYCLSNIGFVYRNLGQYKKSIELFAKCLDIYEKIQDKNGVAYSLNNLGSTYFEQKNYTQALTFSNRSMVLSTELGFPEKIRNSAEQLNKIYKATGNHKLALQNYELYIQMRDSLNNESTRKASIKSQLKYEYEKQAAADSVAHAKESEIKNVQLQKQTAEIKAKKNQQYGLLGGLSLVIIFAGFMFNRFKVTQKQKRIIEAQKTVVEEQKHLVEEKQKEVMDSIRYAKRIQIALLPRESYITRVLQGNKK